jgi:Myb-like DNA-binding protein FlbD
MLPQILPSEMSEFINLRQHIESLYIENSKKELKKRTFTVYEDAMIRLLTSKLKTINWKNIAKYIPGKTTRQCRERYQTYLAPGINVSPWTKEEDELLAQKYKELGSKWSEISAFFNGRSANALKNRYNVHIVHREKTKKADKPNVIEKVMQPQAPRIVYPSITKLLQMSGADKHSPQCCSTFALPPCILHLSNVTNQ